MTSFPFKVGKALAWDATSTDSSTSSLCSTILYTGSASSAAEDLKRRKYSQRVADFEFVPVAVETSGIIGSAGCSLLTDIGRRILRATNHLRQMSYIFQRISVVIFRCNAQAIVDRSFSFASSSVWNSIPNDVRCAPSLLSFKSRLKTCLFRSVYKG